MTIAITAVFGLLAASSPSFAAIGIFAALWSVGVGGNLPVDSAIFLEYDPSSPFHICISIQFFADIGISGSYPVHISISSQCLAFFGL